MSSLEDAHEFLADELTGLIRDVVMLHAPDRHGECRGCNIGPWSDRDPYGGPYMQWIDCPTIRLIREGVGL